ncbi:MAG TPA: hypothetical protein PLO63_11345 [Syntrophales bacterium]|nr:hypothetical protein [Syntrophales bacterium]
MIIQPNLKWYIGISDPKGLDPRCPFASVYRCPRYYQSLSLLGEAGSTKIDPKEDKLLNERWQKTDVWPTTQEQETSVSGPEGENKHFSNFCPEVLFDRFGLFATGLYKYSDDIDRNLAHNELSNEGASPDDWRWSWQYVEPIHYTECLQYSLLKAGKMKSAPVSAFPDHNKDEFERKNDGLIIGEPPPLVKYVVWFRKDGKRWVKENKLIATILLFVILISTIFTVPQLYTLISGWSKTLFDKNTTTSLEPISQNNRVLIISESSGPTVEIVPLRRDSKEIPRDISQAKKTMSIISKGQFTNVSGLIDVSNNIPGYFELKASPSPSRYSYACAVTNSKYGTNYLVSARIAGLQGAEVLELQGIGVWFAINTSQNLYFVYESEENWTTWRKLTIERDPNINSLIIDQNGRNVKVFLNGLYVTTFIKSKEPVPGPVGICFKASPQTGGLIQFQKLSIGEFRN